MVSEKILRLISEYDEYSEENTKLLDKHRENATLISDIKMAVNKDILSYRHGEITAIIPIVYAERTDMISIKGI